MNRRLETLLLFGTFGAVAAFVMSTMGLWPGSGATAGALGSMGLASDSNSRGPHPRIRVEVLNGVGTPELAERVTEWLRGRGFDVVHYGNAATFDRAHSVIIDRSALPERARRVGNALEIERLETDLAPKRYLDATVILGMDWTALPDPERSRGLRGWIENMWSKLFATESGDR